MLEKDKALAIYLANSCDIEISKINISNIKFPDHMSFYSACIQDSKLINIQGEYLNFENTFMPKTIFSSSLLEKCNFRNSNLEKAIFDGANLKKCDFIGANLTGGSFVRADLTDVKLTPNDLIVSINQKISIEFINLVKHLTILIEELNDLINSISGKNKFIKNKEAINLAIKFRDEGRFLIRKLKIENDQLRHFSTHNVNSINNLGKEDGINLDDYDFAKVLRQLSEIIIEYQKNLNILFNEFNENYEVILDKLNEELKKDNNSEEYSNEREINTEKKALRRERRNFQLKTQLVESKVLIIHNMVKGYFTRLKTESSNQMTIVEGTVFKECIGLSPQQYNWIKQNGGVL